VLLSICLVTKMLTTHTFKNHQVLHIIVVLAKPAICRFCIFYFNNIYTYSSRFMPEGVAEASQIFIRDAHVLPKIIWLWVIPQTWQVIWDWSQSISVLMPLVAFYDIHGGKRDVLFFYFVPDTTRVMIFLQNVFTNFFTSS
jgi:hypothetical protein